MNATTKTTFAEVTEAFEQVYERLSEENNEAAPNSYTWLAPTLGELAIEAERNLSELADKDIQSRVGHQDDRVIGWVFECNGNTLHQITESAIESELLELFEFCMGLES